MAKLEFQNKTLETFFRNYKWTRNNSIQMLDAAIENNIMDSKPESKQFTFQPIKYQFQCLVTTTNTYYRQLTNSSNQEFAVLVDEDKAVAKKDLPQEELATYLAQQIKELESLFKSYNNTDFDKNIKTIQAISNHEYLHQGQLLVMFREAGVDVPERFKDAFAL